MTSNTSNRIQPDDYGERWRLPCVHRVYSPQIVNQLTEIQCQSASASQLLWDNHSIHYGVADFYNRLIDSNNQPGLKLTNVARVLNQILSDDACRYVFISPKSSVHEFFKQRIQQNKAWIVSLQEEATSSHGHTLVICGLTINGAIKAKNPWGRGPDSGYGSLCIIPQHVFFKLWENSRFRSVFPVLT